MAEWKQLEGAKQVAAAAAAVASEAATEATVEAVKAAYKRLPSWETLSNNIRKMHNSMHTRGCQDATTGGMRQCVCVPQTFK